MRSDEGTRPSGRGHFNHRSRPLKSPNVRGLTEHPATDSRQAAWYRQICSRLPAPPSSMSWPITCRRDIERWRRRQRRFLSSRSSGGVVETHNKLRDKANEQAPIVTRCRNDGKRSVQGSAKIRAAKSAARRAWQCTHGAKRRRLSVAIYARDERHAACPLPQEAPRLIPNGAIDNQAQGPLLLSHRCVCLGFEHATNGSSIKSHSPQTSLKQRNGTALRAQLEPR